MAGNALACLVGLRLRCESTENLHALKLLSKRLNDKPPHIPISPKYELINHSSRPRWILILSRTCVTPPVSPSLNAARLHFAVFSVTLSLSFTPFIWLLVTVLLVALFYSSLCCLCRRHNESTVCATSVNDASNHMTCWGQVCYYFSSDQNFSLGGWYPSHIYVPH